MKEQVLCYQSVMDILKIRVFAASDFEFRNTATTEA